MHKFQKICFCMLYAAILFVLSVLPVYAGTGQSEQDGISVSYTTDKEQYKGTDEITAKLKVTNNNAGSVYEIELDENIPEGYALKEGSLRYKSIAELKPGESEVLETVYLKIKGASGSGPDTSESAVAEEENGSSQKNTDNTDNSGDDKTVTKTPAKDTENPAKNTENSASGNDRKSPDKSSAKEKKNQASRKNGSNPTTGDDQPVVVYIVIALAALVLIALLTRRKWRKFLSLFLVFTMIETLVPGLELEVKAANNEIQVMTEVDVDGESVVFAATVRYVFSEPIEQYDENNVGEIYYEPTEEEHIAVSDDESTAYADNEILVVAKSGVSKTEMMNLAAQYEARVVGYIEQTRDYQWKFDNTKSEKEFENIINEIKCNDLVEDAYMNYIMECSETLADVKYGSQWLADLVDSSDLEGKSWGIEAINVPAAWNFFEKRSTKINPVKVGLVDSGFDALHEEFQFSGDQLFYNNETQNGLNSEQAERVSRTHGTHVAGIMAADGTNDEGINGVYPYGKGNLYGVSCALDNYSENGTFHSSSMFQKIAYAELIVRNVKVINQSMGFNWQQYYEKNDEGKYKNESSFAESMRSNYKSLDDLYAGFDRNDSVITEKRYEAEKYADFLNRLIALGYDFVIVSAAGNTYGKESEYNSYNNLIPNTAGYKDVYERVIVVGSIGVRECDADNKLVSFDKYAISSFSDAGNRVDIFAPGEYIFSTLLTGNEYGYDSGTSMAAPHIAGVCANIWSTYNELSGSEIKDIVLYSLLTDGGSPRCPYISPNGNKKGIVDCKLAVENAAKIKSNSSREKDPDEMYGAIEGWVYEADPNGEADKSKPVADAIIRAYGQDGSQITVSHADGKTADEVKTDEKGHYEFFVHPGTYRITASKTGFKGSESAAEDNISVEMQEVYYAKPLVLVNDTFIIGIEESENEKITKLLNDYVAQREFMYGKSYTYTIYPRSQYNANESDEWDNISPDQLLGYTIEDFDDDGCPELLIIKAAEDYMLQFDMYGVTEDTVILKASLPIESDDGYKGPQLPGAEYVSTGNLSGLLSCFVSNEDHRIFLQVCDTLWVGGGSEVFAISAVYKNGEFLDYRVSHTMGNGLMEFEAEKLTEELANVGIPNPDARRVFDEFLPLTEFFDGNVHEFVRAEQHTVPAEQKGNYFTKVVSQTDFFPVEAM